LEEWGEGVQKNTWIPALAGAVMLVSGWAPLTAYGRSLEPESAGAATSPDIRAETLLRATSSWDGVPYRAYPAGPPEVTLLRLTIPAHTNLPWHTHPMPNAAYVVSGEITVEKKSDGTTRLLKAGDVLAEMVDATHRGRTGSEPVVLLVFYAGTPGMSLSHTEE